MGYGGTPSTKLPTAFGNGSDGDLHVQADAYITSAELNLASLTIDAGFELKVKEWWLAPYLSVVNIRCQTPVVLNGKITANGVTALPTGSSISRTGGGNISGDYYVGYVMGQTPSVCYDYYDGDGGVPANIFPVCGGCEAGSLFVGTLPASTPMPYAGVPYGAAPSDFVAIGADFAHYAGPDRQFRYAAGAGGSGDTGSSDKAGGDGGGIICIYAPQIIFGANGGIEAKGTDGEPGGLDANTGGGGGGYIETWTQVPLTELEKARCLVTGGAAGGVSGYAGLDGVRHFMEI